MSIDVETPWVTDNWWTSPFNFIPEVRQQLNLPDRVTFHDVTLRDGEQTPDVVFQKDEKVRIAQLLDDAGVDRIEVSLPAVSAEDVEATKTVTQLGLQAEVFVLSRATARDIDLAVECGVDGVCFEVPIGLPRLRFQFPSWTQDDVIQKSIDNLRYARERGLKVAYFMMDSTRAEPAFLFTRESGMGVDLVRSQPLGLFCLHPKLVGQEASYVLGKKSGAPSIAMKIEDLGLDATEEQSKEILLRVKTLGAQKKGLVTDEEFRTIHAEVIGG